MKKNNRKIPFLSVLILLILTLMMSACVKGAKRHKAKGYSYLAPVNWIKVENKKKKSVFSRFDSNVSEIVQYVTKAENRITGRPEAKITLYSTKLFQATWIEDEFPLIVIALKKSGYKILKKGVIKLDGRVTRWILFRDKKASEINLEFYLIDDTNQLIKFQFSAHPEAFDVYRLFCPCKRDQSLRLICRIFPFASDRAGRFYFSCQHRDG